MDGTGTRDPGLHALLVSRSGALEHETYHAGYDVGTPHPLYSGTKSFWGVAALFAQSDGLLDLDERVAGPLPQWDDGGPKSLVTLRMLLNLTAGFGFGGLGAAVPGYERALAIPLKNEPGSRFTYGGVALQVFGAVMAHKLESRQMTPHEYLRARVLDPIGVTIASWRTLADGTHPLPTGAQMTARSWLAYGLWVSQHHTELRPAFQGSAANPRYGLCWWLGAKGAPSDLVYASGAAGQALYVVPSQKLVIVRFGKNASFKHEVFLRRFFA
jgi:CubicO group peptidase (beta-lactamase class C family)